MSFSDFDLEIIEKIEKANTKFKRKYNKNFILGFTPACNNKMVTVGITLDNRTDITLKEMVFFEKQLKKLFNRKTKIIYRSTYRYRGRFFIISQEQ